MKTSLRSKLLKLILSLFIVPITLMLVFYYLYINSMMKNEIISLSKNILIQKNAVIERTKKPQSKLQTYLKKQENFLSILILDKDLNILASVRNTGKR